MPIELYVEIARPHDHYPAGMARLDLELTGLIGYPVIVAHCPVGQELLLAGESARSL